MDDEEDSLAAVGLERQEPGAVARVRHQQLGAPALVLLLSRRVVEEKEMEWKDHGMKWNDQGIPEVPR